jgi:hypothetical protein
MTKIDRRKSYYLTIDTETANTLECPLVFDLGGAVHDKKGNVCETFSFIIREVYYDMPDLMASCYYQSKLPMYDRQIANGGREVVSLVFAKMYIKNLCEKYNIKAIIAHNMAFDYRATITTQRYVTSSKYRYFLPYGVELWDTLKMAQDTICAQNTYVCWCAQNGFLKKNGTPRATAEILYKYISCDIDFEEEHTGLADVLIEIQIFAKCMAQHKKMRKKVWE